MGPEPLCLDSCVQHCGLNFIHTTLGSCRSLVLILYSVSLCDHTTVFLFISLLMDFWVISSLGLLTNGVSRNILLQGFWYKHMHFPAGCIPWCGTTGSQHISGKVSHPVWIDAVKQFAKAVTPMPSLLISWAPDYGHMGGSLVNLVCRKSEICNQEGEKKIVQNLQESSWRSSLN